MRHLKEILTFFTIIQLPLVLYLVSRACSPSASLQYGNKNDEDSLQTHGYPTCAFVANNPNLTLGHAGKIDQHDWVFRFNGFYQYGRNITPPGDYQSFSPEKYGRKTTHAVLSPWRKVLRLEDYIKDVDLLPWQNCRYRPPPTKEDCSKATWCLDFEVYYRPEELQRYGCTPLGGDDDRKAHQLIKEKHTSINNTFHAPTTGFIAWLRWSRVCTKISFYGFTNEEDVTDKTFHSYEIEHMIIKERSPNATHHS